MEYSKIFKSELEKQYWNIAQGTKKVSSENCDEIIFLLPSKDAMQMNKQYVGTKVLKVLNQALGRPILSQWSEKVFLATPSQCTASVSRGSFVEDAFETSKEVMISINTLWGHYIVALETIEFLKNYLDSATEQLNKIETPEQLESLRKFLESQKMQRPRIIPIFPWAQQQTPEERMKEMWAEKNKLSKEEEIKDPKDKIKTKNEIQEKFDYKDKPVVCGL